MLKFDVGDGIFYECSPPQKRPIHWGWTNEVTSDGLVWASKPRGEVEMPHIAEYFDWSGEWTITPRPEFRTGPHSLYGSSRFHSVFTTACRFLGTEEALMRLATGDLDDDLDDIALEMCAWQETLIKRWPWPGRPDLLIVGDDIGTSHGQLMSHEMYLSSLYVPHLGFALRSKGVPIWYHSDGVIDERTLGLIKSTGYDGIYYEDIGGMRETLSRVGLKGIPVRR